VMRWCREGELADLWRTAGLREVRFGPLIVAAHYADFEDLWSPFPHGVAPSGAFCKALSEHDRSANTTARRCTTHTAATSASATNPSSSPPEHGAWPDAPPERHSRKSLRSRFRARVITSTTQTAALHRAASATAETAESMP
jgi:hypothetical protein